MYWQQIFNVLGDPDWIEQQIDDVLVPNPAELTKEGEKKKNGKTDQHSENDDTVSKKKKKKKQKNKNEAELKDTENGHVEKKRRKDDVGAEPRGEDGESQIVSKKGKKQKVMSGEEITPPKKKSKMLDENSTPEKLPQHVDRCRPAAFGQRKTPGSTKLAKAKSSVKLERPDPATETKGNAGDLEDKDLEVNEDSDDSVDIKPPALSRQSHKRSCKKKTLSEGKQRMLAVKKYLSNIGLTYPLFLRTHSRQGAMVKIGEVAAVGIL